MSSITNFNKNEMKNNEKYSLKRFLATVLLFVQLGNISSVSALENEETDLDDDLPVFSTIEWCQNNKDIDDDIVIFEPDYCTIPTPLEIDENATEEEKLKIYYDDMLENGAKTEGTYRLINWFIGPITDLKINNDQTINDIARDICIKNYSGESGKNKWNLGKKYVSSLFNIIDEECQNIPNRKIIENKWANKTGGDRSLSFDNPEEIACVVALLVEFINDNDPTKVANDTLNNSGNSKLENGLFNLRVSEYIKKKTISYTKYKRNI